MPMIGLDSIAIVSEAAIEAAEAVAREAPPERQIIIIIIVTR